MLNFEDLMSDIINDFYILLDTYKQKENGLLSYHTNEREVIAIKLMRKIENLYPSILTRNIDKTCAPLITLFLRMPNQMLFTNCDEAEEFIANIKTYSNNKIPAIIDRVFRGSCRVAIFNMEHYLNHYNKSKHYDYVH
jgi:hypothetical protein